VFCLVQFCAFIGGHFDLKRLIANCIFYTPGKFANILVIYTWVFLVIPFLLPMIEKLRVIGVILVLAFSWGSWYFLHAFSISAGYPGSLIFGAGDYTGPSILQGLTLIMFGYALASFKKDRGYRIVTTTMVLVAVILLLAKVWTEHPGSLINGIISTELRFTNHPVYYAYGILASLALLVFARYFALIQALGRRQSLFNALGANSIFAYGFGNMLLNITPEFSILPTYAVAISFAFIAFLAVITSDVNRRNPQYFGLFAIWLRQFMDKWRKFIRSDRKASVAG
jgi:hypothetical protein